jgi:HEAT repeat protein
VESEAPDPIQYDAQGKAVGQSPEFDAWVKVHNQALEDAGANALYVYPGVVLLLGGTRDWKAIPLLRQALSSPNYLIGIAAADGLAEIGDATAGPLILA